MAFDPKRLTSEDMAPGFRCAFYSHPTDGASEVQAAGYFTPGYAALPKGTIIDCALVLNTTPVRRNYIVTASSAAAVVIAPQNVA